MATLVAGLFEDSKAAGEAVSNLKEKGYTDDISVLAKDVGGDVSTHQIKEDVTKSTGTGAAVGAGAGALAGLIAGAVTVAIPGAMLLVGGPLAVIWGVSGAAVGALGGGILGALTKAGFSDEKAKLFEQSIMNGQVLVAVSGDDDKVDSIMQAMKDMGASEIAAVPGAA